VEIELKYFDDVVKSYASKRKDITEDEIEELMTIFIKYLKMKMKSEDYYAINTPLGIFYKTPDLKMLEEVEIPKTKKERLNEKVYLNSKLKWIVRKDYTHDDIQNHTPIKI
jgi:hypothetical protein